MRMIARFAFVAAIAFAGPALAGQAVTLKAETVDSDGQVTLGDLFDGAGSAAGVPVATRAGGTVVLDAGAVQTAARRAGLDWTNAEGYRRIIVRSGATAAAGPQAKGAEVLTYARNINPGEIIQPSDLVWAKVAVASADGLADPDMAIGLAARRPLRAGLAAQTRDLTAPLVIKAGDSVTVTYQAGGVSLSLQGKAEGAATAGESVSVLNLVSKKSIQAVALAPGRAVVGPEADRALAARNQRFALR
jgi:flagella basal body P-ring formation protein FlgA